MSDLVDNYFDEIQITVEFNTPSGVIEFTGTGAEVCQEVYKYSLVFGTIEYKVIPKVPFLYEVKE